MWGWIMLAVWGAFCVLVSGRRKMIGIPMIFVGVFLGLGMVYRVSRVSRLVGVSLLCAAIGGAVMVFLWSPDESADYTDYATSLFTETGERTNALIVSGTITTLKQAGIVGAGLGTATQGRSYANVQATGAAKAGRKTASAGCFWNSGCQAFCYWCAASACWLGRWPSRLDYYLPSVARFCFSWDWWALL